MTRRLTLSSLCLITSLCSSTLADIVIDARTQRIQIGVLKENVVNNGSLSGGVSGLTIPEGYRVSGSGTFVNVKIDGVFAPGNSPGITANTNVAFGANATVQFELGGTDPGFAANNHDQVNDSGTITMGSNTTLEILPFNGFLPANGDQFTIMTWQTGLTSSFPNSTFDPFFASNGVTFSSTYTNLGGNGGLTLTAVSVPEPSAFICLGLAGLLARGLKKRNCKRSTDLSA